MRTRMMLIAALALAACGDDEESKPTPLDASTPFDSTVPTPADATVDATVDASVDAGAPVVVPSDCFLNPTTYLEIINACSSAERVDKKPVLPLIGADGKLPPLP